RLTSHQRVTLLVSALVPSPGGPPARFLFLALVVRLRSTRVQWRQWSYVG
ncbi:unnamed protein product, partial [Closterium sp. NIES-53]